jgi:hypothetical protein
MQDSSIPGRRRPGDETIRLASNNLFSRYGFEDGGSPDAWFDYWNDWRNPAAGQAPDFPWGEVVRRYLLPALDQQVTVTDYGNHNPVRAVTVDGADVTGCWDGADLPWPELTPACVDVPLAEVIALAGELGMLPPTPRGGPPPRDTRGKAARDSAGRRRVQPVRTSRSQRRSR